MTYQLNRHDGYSEYEDYAQIDQRFGPLDTAQEILTTALQAMEYHLNVGDLVSAEFELDLSCYILIANDFITTSWSLVNEYKKLRDRHLNGEIF